MSTRINIASLVSNPANIYYLSGFGDPLSHEREAWMLITNENSYLFTDGRYESKQLEEKLKKQSIFLRILSHERNLTTYLSEIGTVENIQKIEFEADDLTVAEYEKLILPHLDPSTPLRSARDDKSSVILNPAKGGMKDPGVINTQRAIKTATEISLIKRACELVDRLLTKVISEIKIGMSEKEILQMLEDKTYKSDPSYQSYPAFSPIIAIDENSAIPHYDTKSNGKKIVKKGSLILIDCGVRYKNYCSDITRMVSVGFTTSGVVRAYDTLYKAQQQAILHLTQFKTYKKVDKACRKSLANAGYPTYSHATGHGIGILVHELPRFSPHSTDTIKPGHVVTVEPGIYLPGEPKGSWGMRLEDTVLINKDGSTTMLTKSKRELIVI